MTAALNPASTACGHLLCMKCAASVSECPICRQALQTPAVDEARKREIAALAAKCGHCQSIMAVASIDAHEDECLKAGPKPKFVPCQQTSQNPEFVNRSTFSCPLCDIKNMTCEALVRHAVEKHSQGVHEAVCPVCVSMPWGDSSYVSLNWVEHVRMRHKFEYDSYADYTAMTDGKSEDQILQEVLRQSMEQ